nr:hypothetical protein IGGMDNGE_00382 [Pseudomonas aeruginosa]
MNAVWPAGGGGHRRVSSPAARQENHGAAPTSCSGSKRRSLNSLKNCLDRWVHFTRRLPAACRACDERMLCQANCGVLHEQWNQQDECPGFKTFIKRVRFLVEEEGVRPKSVLQGANQLPQNLIAVG